MIDLYANRQFRRPVFNLPMKAGVDVEALVLSHEVLLHDNWRERNLIDWVLRICLM